MKEVKKERVQTQHYIVYVANDGKEFNNSNECEKYENSALCAVRAMYNELVATRKRESELMLECGCDDYYYDFCKVKSQADIETIVRLCSLTFSQDTAYTSKWVETCKKALDTDDYVLVGYNEYDNCYCVADTLKDRIAKITAKFVVDETDKA